MPKLGDAKVYGFRYDQLNRLKAMNAYEWLNNSTNSFSAITLDDYMERLTYDANGNILSYIRNGFGSGIAMNDYGYTYEAGSNRLSELYNSAGGGHSYSYEYDEIGNVTLDSKQGVDAAEWNLYGKLKTVTKSGTDIEYSYDASGQRISKKVNSTEEWYVKDATGNTIATYVKDASVNSGHLSTKEFNKYGSSLLGTEKLVIDVQTPPSPPEIVTFVRGITDYLLNDHRGNNMSMVTDKKLQHSTDGTTIDYYLADVRTASYYSAYGAISKSFNDGQIDLAHNGQKRSTEVSASAQTALYWEYDGDVGRRWNVDPKPRAEESLYLCFSGNPFSIKDIMGDKPTDWVGQKNKDGTYTPVWKRAVHKEGDQAEGEIYIGRDEVISATDGRYYHLRADGNASPTRKPKDRKVADLRKYTPKGKLHPLGEQNKPSASGTPNATSPSPTARPNASPSSEPGKPQNGSSKSGNGTWDVLQSAVTSAPDYISTTVSLPISVPSMIKGSDGTSVPPLTLTTFSVVNDRYGNLYFTPVGASLPVSDKASGSLMLNYMFTPTSREDLKSFLTGTAYSVGGGYIIGGCLTTNSDFSKWSLGIGLTTPGIGGTVSHQPPAFITQGGLTW